MELSGCKEPNKDLWVEEVATELGLGEWSTSMLDDLTKRSSYDGSLHIPLRTLSRSFQETPPSLEVTISGLRDFNLMHVIPARDCPCDLYWVTGSITGWVYEKGWADDLKQISRNELRLLFWHQQDGLCAFCHAPIFPIGAKSHIDHVMPRSKGGADTEDNLQLLCPRCNLVKNNKIVQ